MHSVSFFDNSDENKQLQKKVYIKTIYTHIYLYSKSPHPKHHNNYSKTITKILIIKSNVKDIRFL